MSKSIRKPIANTEGYNPSPSDDDRIPILDHSTGVKGETTFKELGISLMGSYYPPAVWERELTSADTEFVLTDGSGTQTLFEEDTSTLSGFPDIELVRDSLVVDINAEVAAEGYNLVAEPVGSASIRVTVTQGGDFRLLLNPPDGTGASSFERVTSTLRAVGDGDIVGTFEQDLSSAKQEQARANIGVSPSLREVVYVGGDAYVFSDEDSGKIFVTTDNANIDLPHTVSTGFEVLLMSPEQWETELSVAGDSEINNGIKTSFITSEAATQIAKVGPIQWVVGGSAV